MKKIDSLNLIPFIDIVLVLLVIVLTTATFLQQNHLSVDIPKVDGNTATQAINKNDIIISIKDDNGIFLDDNEVNLEQLRFHISRVSKDAHIVLNGDKKSNFEVFAKIMAMLESLEFSNLYILVGAESAESNAKSGAESAESAESTAKSGADSATDSANSADSAK